MACVVFKAHRLLYHSTLGVRVIKKKKMACGSGRATGQPEETDAAGSATWTRIPKP